MNRVLAGVIALALAGVGAPLASGAAPGAVPATGAALTAGRAGRVVIVIGVSGLRWTDISAPAARGMWRIAGDGSVGSLAIRTISPVTCPADAWLTLNAGSRAAAPRPASDSCPVLPRVVPAGRAAPGGRRAGAAPPAVPAAAPPARVPAMRSLASYNARFHYGPHWGVLGQAAGQGRCALAIGPGAALALADPAGRVGRYLPAVRPAGSRSAWSAVLRQCPLSVIDLGALPPAGARRARALGAADRAIAAVASAAPAGAILVLAGMGDGESAHLRVLVVSGPGYRAGTLVSASTRQPGVVAITDLTPSVLRWRDVAVPRQAAPLAGSEVTAAGRGPLAVAIRALIGQDTADQVDRSGTRWFFLAFGAAESALFGLIAFALRGPGEGRARRRATWYTAAAALAAAVPAGTFLAGLARWWRLPHPAAWLYGLGLAWAVLIAAATLAGPWRRGVFGPSGFAGAVTLAVIGVGAMTGSRLEPGAPFGFSLVDANRFYGIGNDAIGVYATAGILAAAWAADAVARRRGARMTAVAVAGGVAVTAVFVSGWPAFGAKTGGTIAMVPAFGVLVAAVAGAAITARRGLVIAVSGFALVAAFAVVNYLGLGPLSHQGDFVRQVLRGEASGTLRRKIGSNLGSWAGTWLSPAVPVVAVVTGLMLGWPARLGMRPFAAACERRALLRPTLLAIWLALVLSGFLEDSGVAVAAAALPFALPLAVALAARAAAAAPGGTGGVAADDGGLTYEGPGNRRVTGKTGGACGPETSGGRG